MTSEKLNMQLVQPCQERAVARPTLVAAVAWWRKRARQREELARLDEWSRRDLGVSEADVWNEVRKPFWLE
jgi:uncharacterized protein YjiS (DUF1127 family)